MKIAIIHPAFGVISTSNQTNIKAVADNYGIFPSTSLAYVAGALQKHNHEITFLDAMASNYSLNDMVILLKKIKPDVMMFSITTYMYHDCIELIRFFKKHIPCKVIVGGANLSLFPKETISNPEIDIGIIGEAEETVVELLSALDKNKDISNIKGIIFKKGKKIIKTKSRPLIKNLDKIPFPARNLLPVDKYYSLISKHKNYTIIITSRGCPFSCIFCEQRTKLVRFRSVKNVVDELEECFNKYNVREFEFFDPLFTINKSRVIEICKEIRRRKLKIYWSCRARVDTVDYVLLREMKLAGCYRVYYGIESGDETVLKNIKKHTTIPIIKKAIKDSKKAGLIVFGYFIIGAPGETLSSAYRTLRLAKQLPLDYVQFNRLSALPGTPLYDLIKDELLGYDYWEAYIKNKSAERELPKYNCDLSNETLNKLIKKFYLSFFLRPVAIIRLLKQIKSFEELKRYIKIFFGLLFS